MAKRSVGRPPKFIDAASFAKAFTSYFEECEKARQMPNKAGLCIWLGIHKDTYNEYRKKPGFSDAIKACEAMIENAWVQRLSSNAPTGAIFYLKNAFPADYREKQEVDHTTAGEKLPGVINIVAPSVTLPRDAEGTDLPTLPKAV